MAELTMQPIIIGTVLGGTIWYYIWTWASNPGRDKVSNGPSDGGVPSGHTMMGNFGLVANQTKTATQAKRKFWHNTNKHGNKTKLPNNVSTSLYIGEPRPKFLSGTRTTNLVTSQDTFNNYFIVE